MSFSCILSFPPPSVAEVVYLMLLPILVVYSVILKLSHSLFVGDDLSRGMLQFAKGVPLGKKGLDWLKIHLVTLHGAKKKSSLEERLNYADEIMDDVLDSADNPLTVSNLQQNCVTVKKTVFAH